MKRLFIALDLPEEAREALSQIGSDIPGARWTDVSQLHLTLRFVGDADDRLFARISSELGGIVVEPFWLTLQGVGRFPPRRDPKILWVGIEKADFLVRLYDLVGAALARCGVAPEDRDFSPHITIARLRDVPSSAIASFLEKNRSFSCNPFLVTEFHLYSSVLTQRGAVHRREQTYLLRSSPLPMRSSPDSDGGPDRFS